MSSIPSIIRRFLFVTLTLAACVACASDTYDAPNTLGVVPLRPPTPIWLGAVAGAPAGSAGAAATPLSGAAAVTPSQVPGWAHVMLSIDNSTAGQLYSWSLHSGSCGSEGAVIGPANRYSEFAIHPDGTGAVETTIPTTLSQSASYAVVATPVAPSGASTACANLTRTAM